MGIDKIPHEDHHIHVEIFKGEIHPKNKLGSKVCHWHTKHEGAFHSAQRCCVYVKNIFKATAMTSQVGLPGSGNQNTVEPHYNESSISHYNERIGRSQTMEQHYNESRIITNESFSRKRFVIMGFDILRGFMGSTALLSPTPLWTPLPSLPPLLFRHRCIVGGAF